MDEGRDGAMTARFTILLFVIAGFLLGLALGLTRAPAVVERGMVIVAPCGQPPPESL